MLQAEALVLAVAGGQGEEVRVGEVGVASRKEQGDHVKAGGSISATLSKSPL